jgi:2-polyprenyl-3-methyl-5-hydroxy-6-metoxy-1,4-benzoquinol methylase
MASDNSLLEYRNCPNCGQNDFTVLFNSNMRGVDLQQSIESATQRDKYGRHVKCRNCHLIYVNPIERQGKINTDYSKRKKDAEIYARVGASIARRSRLYATKSQVQLLKKYQNGGNLLDIGCAEGFFLFNASKAGYITKGIELSQDAAAYARGEFDIDVETKPLEELQFSQDYFDVVTLWQVLEHLPYPLMILKEIYRILKPGGLIVVATPNIAGIPAKVFGRRWWNIKRGHINQFTPKTLVAVLKNAGFKNVSSVSYRESASLLMLFMSVSIFLKAPEPLKTWPHPGSTLGKIMDKVMLVSSSKLDLCTVIGFK